MDDTKRRRVLLGLTSGTLAVLALILGLFSAVSVAITENMVQPYRKRGVPAVATVLFIESTGLRSGSREIDVLYRTGASLEGKVVRATAEVDGWTPGWRQTKAGDELEILYLPEEPESKVLPRASLERAAYPLLSRYEVTLVLLLGSGLLFWLSKRLGGHFFTMNVKELDQD